MKWCVPDHTASKWQCQTSYLTGLSPESIQLTSVPLVYDYCAISNSKCNVFVIYSSLSSPLDLQPHVILPDFSS